MDNPPSAADHQDHANAIGSERHGKGGHVGLKPVIKAGPVDLTRHEAVCRRAIAEPVTGSLDGWPVDTIAKQGFDPSRCGDGSRTFLGRA